MANCRTDFWRQADLQLTQMSQLQHDGGYGCSLLAVSIDILRLMCMCLGRTSSASGNDMSVCFWSSLLAACQALRELTRLILAQHS